MRTSRRANSCMIMVFSALLFLCAGLAGAATEGGHGEADSPKGWAATDTYRVMNFVVLAAALFFLLRKPMSQALNGRIRSIQDQLRELEARKKQAEEELARYNEKLSLLDKEAEKIIAEYVRQGKEARARILREAEAAAKKVEEQASRNIEQEFKLAKEKLQIEILDKAISKAEGMIKENVTDDDQDQLVDEYLKKVVTR